MLKFSDMPYVRPDVDGVMRQMNALCDRMERAADFAEADECFLAFDQLEAEFDTACTLAYVRHQLDTTDEFYDKEVEFIDENAPRVQEAGQCWEKILVSCPHRAQLEEKYGALLFQNAELSLRAFDPKIIPELQEENRLCTQYDKLLASAQIPFEGENRTLAQMTPFKQSADDAIRRRAWEAEAAFYTENGAQLDEIYDQLTHLRDKMGRALGFSGYTGLGYCRMQRNCYGQKEIEAFRRGVIRHIVPIAERLYRAQAERLGVEYPMHFYDMSLNFRSGNACPKGTADDILARTKRFYHELSNETGEFIDFMYRYDLLDVLAKKGKSGGGFCTDLGIYDAPFIFANFNGTSGDVEVVTHEAGHAFAAYTARNVRPRSMRWPGMESCEIHSMSMEFFAWPWAEGFFGDAADKFRFAHLSDALTFIPYGTMVDHFQHEVYAHPDITPAQRHETWRKLLKIYMPWVRLDDGLDFYGEGKGWQRQHHIYESPFYYIDYCLAQTVALQFWALDQRDHEDAWSRYLRLVRLGGTKNYRELVEAAGLCVPFDENALKDVAESATAYLDAFDPARLG